MTLLERAAAQGHADAQCSLGNLHYHGEGVAQDHARAVELFRLAAGQGHAEAQCSLADMHFHGDGVAQDYARAAELWKLAAEQGHAKAQCMLGIMHHHGDGVAQDDARAAELFKLAADQGDAEAQCRLGAMHYHGHGVAQDYARAAELFKLAADQGYAEAQCSLGVMYRDGAGVAQDDARAVDLFRLAAAQGHAEAQCSLARLLPDVQRAPPTSKASKATKASKASNASKASKATARAAGALSADASARASSTDCGAGSSRAGSTVGGTGKSEDAGTVIRQARWPENVTLDADGLRRVTLEAERITAGASAHERVHLMHREVRRMHLGFLRNFVTSLDEIIAAEGQPPEASSADDNISVMCRSALKQLSSETPILLPDAAMSFMNLVGLQWNLMALSRSLDDDDQEEEDAGQEEDLGQQEATEAAAEAAAAKAAAAAAEAATEAAAAAARQLEEDRRTAKKQKEKAKKEAQKVRKEARLKAAAPQSALAAAQAADDFETAIEMLAELVAMVEILPELKAEIDEGKDWVEQRQRELERERTLQLRHDNAVRVQSAVRRWACEQRRRRSAVAVLQLQSALRGKAARRAAAVMRTQPREVQPAELAAATDAFAEAKQVGEGAFGIVFRADVLPSLAYRPGPYAIKRTRESSPAEMEATWKEVRLLASLQHEHLLPLLGYSLSAMRAPCLVYPLCRGGNFEDRLRPTDERSWGRLRRLGFLAPPPPLLWQERLAVLVGALKAVLHLHAHKAAHRDIKPSNVLLSESLVPFLGDTGLAKVTHSDDSRRGASTAGGIAGTGGFLDPLLFKAGAPDYSLADGYAMGVTMLMALTGLPVALNGMDIEEVCELKAGDDLSPEHGPLVADAAAQWPDGTASELILVYQGLTAEKKKKRLALSAALGMLLATQRVKDASFGSSHPQGAIAQESSAPGNMPGAGESVERRGSSSSSSSSNLQSQPTRIVEPPALPPERAAPEPPPPPDSLKNAVAGLRLPHADAEKHRREELVHDIKEAFSNVKTSLERLYVGATGGRPQALETNVEAIQQFYVALNFPLTLKHDLDKLRRWRNAGEHGIAKFDDDGSRRVHPWVDCPQGPPMFPTRQQIKSLVANINDTWLQEALSCLAIDLPRR